MFVLSGGSQKGKEDRGGGGCGGLRGWNEREGAGREESGYCEGDF